MGTIEILVDGLASVVGLVIASRIVEASRSAPKAPEKLVWAPGVSVQYLDLRGIKVRCITTGSGPLLVLLHTLRTQLDLFEKVVPHLAKYFTVYALDCPGHGYSDIPEAKYDADFFVQSVEGFLSRLDLQDATLCGVSRTFKDHFDPTYLGVCSYLAVLNVPAMMVVHIVVFTFLLRQSPNP